MPALNELRESQAGAAVVHAWRWWTGELAAMVPDRLRPDPDKIARADISLGRDAVEVEVVEAGEARRLSDPRRIEDLDAEGWAELASLIAGSRARILLASPDTYVTEVALPKAARKRLRSAVALQLSHLSPIEPALLRWAMEVAEIGPETIVVRVAMARAERIEALQSLFEANGIAPPPVDAATPDGGIELARGDDGGRRLGSPADRRAWALAAFFTLTIPLTTTLGAYVLEASTQSRVAALEREIGPRLETETRARRAEGLRGALRPLVARPSASSTIEDLAGRLPLTDHVKSVEQAGDRTLRFTVETADADAAQAALQQSPLLPGIAVSDIVPAAGGKLSATYRTSPR